MMQGGAVAVGTQPIQIFYLVLYNSVCDLKDVDVVFTFVYINIATSVFTISSNF